MSTRRFSVKFSGVGSSAYHDGQMNISYFNVFGNKNADGADIGGWTGGKVSDYKNILGTGGYRDNEEMKKSTPIIENYSSDSTYYNVDDSQGLCGLSANKSGDQYSVYRREYEVYERPGAKIEGFYINGSFYSDDGGRNLITPRDGWYYIDKTSRLGYLYSGGRYTIADRVRVFTGPWEPVSIKGTTGYFYDFNITNGRSYQYIMYPSDSLSDNNDSVADTVSQVFANSVSTVDGAKYYVWKPNPDDDGQGEMIEGTEETSGKYGAPVVTNWDSWSICELEPVEFDEDIPIVKNTYQVNLDQVWMFKYSLETGSQTQNISRNEIQTLGQFPKIGFGETNYISGEVSALLGDEIIPYSKEKYIERLRESRLKPLSTNEKAKMLKQWRAFVGSKNPKLLRDIKGQSWIVQIMGSSNTPKNFYLNQPDTISFQWKQVEDTSNVVIYSRIEDTDEQSAAKGSDTWDPIYKGKKEIDQASLFYRFTND